MIPGQKEKNKETKMLVEFGLGPTTGSTTQDRAILLFWGPKKIMIMIIPEKKEKKQEKTQK